MSEQDKVTLRLLTAAERYTAVARERATANRARNDSASKAAASLRPDVILADVTSPLGDVALILRRAKALLEA